MSAGRVVLYFPDSFADLGIHVSGTAGHVADSGMVPVRYLTIGGIGTRLGVKPGTASGWLRRHANTPAPAALLQPGRLGDADPGWAADQVPEWEAWLASLRAGGVWVPPARAPVVYLGVAGVAGWLGVKPATVSAMLIRHAGTPAPAGLFEPGRRHGPDRGWLPAQEQAWRDWRASLPGAGAPGVPRERDPGWEARRVRAVRDSRPPSRTRPRVDIAASFPLRAEVPFGPVGTVRAAIDAAGGRLAVTSSPDPAVMFVWARDHADAAAAAAAMPGLEFRADGEQGR